MPWTLYMTGKLWVFGKVRGADAQSSSRLRHGDKDCDTHVNWSPAHYKAKLESWQSEWNNMRTDRMTGWPDARRETL